MAQLAPIGPLLHDRAALFAGRIGRHVIDVDDLIGPAAVERRADLLDQRHNVIGFVAHGNDDGNRGLENRRLGRQIEARGWNWLGSGTGGPAGSRFYGADAPWATLLRRPETAPARGTMVPSARMAKPSLRAANQYRTAKAPTKPTRAPAPPSLG